MHSFSSPFPKPDNHNVRGYRANEPSVRRCARQSTHRHATHRLALAGRRKVGRVLIIAGLLSVVGAAFAPRAHGAATGPDKFIPTMLVYYGGGPKLDSGPRFPDTTRPSS